MMSVHDVVACGLSIGAGCLFAVIGLSMVGVGVQAIQNGMTAGLLIMLLGIPVLVAGGFAARNGATGKITWDDVVNYLF